ncbi:hypothetical protein BB559_003904 [Furculomyces boomerangus]|uniref:Tr-type G domain-containing protein n=1 Tax=Furculomyces boomerangus TaxID=61424 RepID=A0A2T9YI23_9FUNG|nr:hypothetical protein BB559_003904 [Furculomyces boomerangus]
MLVAAKITTIEINATTARPETISGVTQLKKNRSSCPGFPIVDVTKCLSTLASTAAFDKNPQSQTRGITLDLGFSSFSIYSEKLANEIQVTLVDCPGHASLVKTVIGGSQIMDGAVLVVDVTKGIQTQTAECIVLAEILEIPLVIAINKIDLVPQEKQQNVIEKVTKGIKKALKSTRYDTCNIVAISTKLEPNVSMLITAIGDLLENNGNFDKDISKSSTDECLLAYEHCFTLKGQGTIVTGTMLKGTLSVGDAISVGYETVTAKATFLEYRNSGNVIPDDFLNYDYMALDELNPKETNIGGQQFVYLDWGKPIYIPKSTLIIASKLDSDQSSSNCRLAFYGDKVKTISDKEYKNWSINNIHTYRIKEKFGNIFRVVDQNTLIGNDMFSALGIAPFIQFKVDIVDGSDVVATGRQRAAEVLNNLPQLQNLIKRDPPSYKEEFLQQWRHFESSLGIFELKPEEEYKDFGDLLMFLSHVSVFYTKECEGYAEKLLSLLQRHYMVLNPNFRKSIVQSVILMGNKRQIQSTQVLPVFFTMFRCQDKVLRETLYNYIVNDIKSANKGQHRNNQLNKTIQNYLFSIINSPEAQNKSSPGAIAAKKSLDVCIELYKKNIWNDAKTTNVIALGCFSPITKIKVTCIQFFLNPVAKKTSGDDSDSEEDQSDTEENKPQTKANLNYLQRKQSFTKKTRYTKRVLDKALRVHKKQMKSNTEDSENEFEEELELDKKKSDQPHFRVLSLLHDPQSFAEKLFSSATSSTKSTKKGGQTIERFEVRLMQLKLVSRVVGYHQLFVASFYPFMMRYLQPHQRDITTILALYATACHQFTPPDIIQPQIKAIANNFVSDHCSPEVISAGLNSIRAVAVRQPLVLDSDILSDLIEYRKHKNKGVMMAARSLLQVYREKFPEMLHRRERGKAASEALIKGEQIKPLFGQEKVHEGVEDLESGDELEESGDGWKDMDENEEIEFSEEGELESGSDVEEEQVDASSDDEENSDEPETEQDSIENPEKASAPRADTMRILTQEDFLKIEKIKRRQKEKLQEEQENSTGGKGLKRKGESSTKFSATKGEDKSEGKEYIDASDILGEYHSRKRAKASYEERLASIQTGREGREKYSSKKSKRESDGRSTSNKEKRKTKSFKMIAHKQGNVVKGKRSLVQKRKELRAHITKQKKKGH